MAADWATVSLAALCEFRAGTVFKPALQGRSSGDFPFVKVSDMNLPANAVRIQDANNWVSGDDLRELRAKPFPPGTVVFAKIGEALRQNRLRQVVRETVVDNNVMGAVPRVDRIDARYFYYALSQFDFSDVAQGTALPYLTVASLSALTLDVPPANDQRAIARILGTLDDKIELNRRINETLDAIARALFKSWFVDFDPVRAKAEGRDPGLPKPLADLFPDSFEDSELGEIPKGWSAVPLYDIATYINGAAYAAFEPNDERRGLAIIKIAELKAGVTAQTKFSEVQMPEKYRIARGDILFSWSGNPDTSIDTFVWSHGPAWLNQHIFRVVPHHQHERAFVLLTLRTLRPVFAEIARNKQTTGLGHVTGADMKRLLVARQDDRLMRAWNVVAAPLLGRAFESEVEVHYLSSLRDALLPKLISGELRLKAAERIVETV